MSSPAEESPAQRSARLRRERRQAKINEGGAARLDKITSLSGRTPQSERDDSQPAPSASVSPSPSPQPQASAPAPSRPSPAPAPAPVSTADDPSPESQQAQQEFIRSLLRQSAPSPAPDATQPPNPSDDPTMKLLESLMSGGIPGTDGPDGGPNGNQKPSPGDLASALGLPPFVSSMLGAAARPQSDEEKNQVQVWKVLHALFAIAIGSYLLFALGTSISTFGSQPPPPATARNPFLFFTTGEVVLTGLRVALKGRNGGLTGMAVWMQAARDVIRDGSLALFLLGMGAWWFRGWNV